MNREGALDRRLSRWRIASQRNMSLDDRNMMELAFRACFRHCKFNGLIPDQPEMASDVEMQPERLGRRRRAGGRS
jgi:hypothetical protein